VGADELRGWPWDAFILTVAMLKEAIGKRQEVSVGAFEQRFDGLLSCRTRNFRHALSMSEQIRIIALKDAFDFPWEL
jgi:hypothetical protein